MKKTLLLSLALGLTGATSLLAGTVDVYITGSTAFRATVYTACEKLYTTTPNIWYATAAFGGANSGFSSSTSSWVMSGTPISTLTNLQGNTLVIHGLFTGSVQGLKAVENNEGLAFAQPTPANSPGGNASTYITNSATIAFSDASGASTPYPATGNYAEEQVCVQPFVLVKSQAPSGAVTNISNVTWEQLDFAVSNGRIPASAWTGKVTDTNSFVYLFERTKDSGTRRTLTASEGFQFNSPVGIYLWDSTNNTFYTATSTNNGIAGGAPLGVIGTEGPGVNNDNLSWGYGYIGGGDIKTALNYANVANQSISYLSISDSRGVGSSNWANVVSYNGIWPTAQGAGIHGYAGTNDFSPITSGYYPCWGVEVLVHLVNPASDSRSDQDISATQLGNQNTPGTFLGVFNSQTYINGGSPIAGSIENEIELSKTPGYAGNNYGALGIRLSDMINSRSAVGGVIAPPFN